MSVKTFFESIQRSVNHSNVHKHCVISNLPPPSAQGLQTVIRHSGPDDRRAVGCTPLVTRSQRPPVDPERHGRSRVPSPSQTRKRSMMFDTPQAAKAVQRPRSEADGQPKRDKQKFSRLGFEVAR